LKVTRYTQLKFVNFAFQKGIVQRMLKLQFRDRRQEAIWLVDPLFTIGSSPENSLVINDTNIADFHAEIQNENNKVIILSQNKDATIYINNEKITKAKQLNPGDIIKLGNIELDVIDPQSTQYQSSLGLKPAKAPEWKLKSTASWMENQLFPIEGKTVLGREANCDISIPVEHLSRRHVEFEVKGGKLLIRDLDSSNGTFLNGNSITESYAKPGDKIKVDVISFEVIGPQADPNKTIIRSIGDPKPTKKKLENNNTKKPSVQTRIKAKPSAKSPSLASKGKQAWIEEPTISQSKTNYWWFAIAGFSITLLAIVAFISL
jgi:pSer/pThr/pTyr-binding forkhead associated (FHA) protein